MNIGSVRTRSDQGSDAFIAASAVFVTFGSNHDPQFLDDPGSADDFNGHGTHVAGIVASSDATYPGVAPSTFIVDAKCGYNTVSGGGSLENPDIFKAADWAAGQGAAVLNGSFGDTGNSGESAITHFFDAVVDDLRVPFAVAAGNEGPGSGTVGSPGDLYNGLSVASLNDKGTAAHADNVLSTFSSRGPTADGRRKPDLAAPGENVTSTNAFWEGSSDFVTESGTSMAAPMVAGSMSLLLDYSGSWTPEELRALLLGTVRNTNPYPTTPDFAWGFGACDLAAAYASRATPASGTFAKSGPAYLLFRAGSLPLAGRATLAWDRQVVYAGTKGPTSHPALIDLDLEVYDEDSGALRGSSGSALDSVEQLKTSAAVASPVLKVIRRGSFPSSLSTQAFAVATSGTAATTAISPPLLTGTIDVPVAVAAGAGFDVTFHLHNGGQAAAATPTATLTIPAGFVLASGVNPRGLATLAGGGDVAVTWTLTAPATAATGTLSATAASTTFGLAFDAGIASGQVRCDAVAPTAPSGLSAAALDATTVRFDWVDTSSIETGFEVSRSEDGGGSSVIATLPADARFLEDPGLDSDHSYAYEIRALGVVGPSAWAGPATVQTLPTLVLTLGKGSLTDRTKIRKDAVKIAGTFQFSGSLDSTFTLPGEPVTVGVGAPGSPWSLEVPGDSPRWSGTGAKRKWRSPPGTLPRAVVSLDLVLGTWSLAASGLDLDTPLPTTIEVLLRVGNDAGTVQQSFHAGRPGILKYP